jgi:hypothetical protein
MVVATASKIAESITTSLFIPLSPEVNWFVFPLEIIETLMLLFRIEKKICLGNGPTGTQGRSPVATWGCYFGTVYEFICRDRGDCAFSRRYYRLLQPGAGNIADGVHAGNRSLHREAVDHYAPALAAFQLVI